MSQGLRLVSPQSEPRLREMSRTERNNNSIHTCPIDELVFYRKSQAFVESVHEIFLVKILQDFQNLTLFNHRWQSRNNFQSTICLNLTDIRCTGLLILNILLWNLKFMKIFELRECMKFIEKIVLHLRVTIFSIYNCFPVKCIMFPRNIGFYTSIYKCLELLLHYIQQKH